MYACMRLNLDPSVELQLRMDISRHTLSNTCSTSSCCVVSSTFEVQTKFNSQLNKPSIDNKIEDRRHLIASKSVSLLW